MSHPRILVIVAVLAGSMSLTATAASIGGRMNKKDAVIEIVTKTGEYSLVDKTIKETTQIQSIQINTPEMGHTLGGAVRLGRSTVTFPLSGRWSLDLIDSRAGTVVATLTPTSDNLGVSVDTKGKNLTMGELPGVEKWLGIIDVQFNTVQLTQNGHRGDAYPCMSGKPVLSVESREPIYPFCFVFQFAS